MTNCHLLAALCVVFYSIAGGSYAIVRLPENVTIPAVIVFGDSIVDAGNNNDLFTVCKCNFPPYGRDFQGGKATGRFSNGKIPSDFLAEELGVKELVPAYLDPTIQMDDLLTGVTFATGCSGYDPVTGAIYGVKTLTDQLNSFREYIEILKAAVGENRTASILSQSMYLVATGTNDFTTTYFLLPDRRQQYNLSSYIDFTASAAAGFFQELYGLGARRVVVLSLPPQGCLPSQRTLAGGILRLCVEEYNEAAMLFNSKLMSVTHSLNNQLPDAKFVYADLYNPLLLLINDPRPTGFEVVNRGCCGSGDVEVAILCNRFDLFTCTDDSVYLFWDSYHPTQRAYKLLVHQLLTKIINDFF
ncbi:hypothetical protein Nepgr_016753 [Nepenthes gracilis]|uniref:GDSL esterase/lipase EXL3 n=1 Tax=Nepenthes gracilis TaxID=150966 RepID=A0AAD3SR42_NEPGR|nr:hypothetical protein Nepgr_016753 [Nepenthes gracilis]